MAGLNTDVRWLSMGVRTPSKDYTLQDLVLSLFIVLCWRVLVFDPCPTHVSAWTVLNILHAKQAAAMVGTGAEEQERGERLLLGLPYEILRYMARFLDGYSLCNLSLTCSLLRDVCCSLLEDRGLVIHEWEPVQKDGRRCWQITYKVGIGVDLSRLQFDWYACATSVARKTG